MEISNTLDAIQKTNPQSIPFRDALKPHIRSWLWIYLKNTGFPQAITFG
jgi:hypothetical protein